MKNEKSIKHIISMPICSLVGIFVGIIFANSTDNNIGVGIILGWAIGFFIGSIISLFISKLTKK